MRVTVSGYPLAQDWKTRAVSSGRKPTVKVASSVRTVWNGNPFCEPGCVLYLPGLPGSGTKIYDFSGQGNTGTITAALWKRLPSGLWCLDFDGTDDYVTFTQINCAADFTQQAWCNLASTENLWRCLSYGASDNNRILLKPTTAHVEIGTANSYNPTFSSISNTWVLITLTRKSGTVCLYINNTEATTGGTATGHNTSYSTLRFGTQTQLTYDWIGGITLYRLLNGRGLSAGEISQQYNQEKHLFGV